MMKLGASLGEIKICEHHAAKIRLRQKDRSEIDCPYFIKETTPSENDT